MEQQKLAVTTGPGIDLLSLVSITDGTMTNIAKEPRKLQKEETKPTWNNARSGGKTIAADTWNKSKAATPPKYLLMPVRFVSFLQFPRNAMTYQVPRMAPTQLASTRMRKPVRLVK